MMQEKTFVGRSHKTRFLPALAVIGALFAVAMMSGETIKTRTPGTKKDTLREAS